MLKVFLVEDERVVREGLRDSISWAQYGFTFAGEASDGEMALPLIQKVKPDILITDIKMPFMDGLDLSRLVCREFPNMKIIVISGYDNFEFARRAIEISVEQYLLKPITKAKLLTALEAVRKKIEEEQDQQDYLQKFQLEAQEYEQYSRRAFFERLISGTLSVREMYEQAEPLGIDLKAPGYNMVLFTLQSSSAGVEYSEKLARLQEELLQFFFCYPEYALFRWNLMTYAVLIKGEPADLDALTQQCIENIKRRCDMASSQLEWYVAASHPISRLSALPQCFQQANQALSYRHLLPQQHILTPADTPTHQETPQVHTLAHLDVNKTDGMLIRNFLQSGSPDEVLDFATEFLAGLGSALDSKIFCQYLMLEIRFNATIFIKSLGYSQEDFLKTADCLDTLSDEAHRVGLKSYLTLCLRRAMELREQGTQNQYRDILRRALRFIDQNYADESISLNSVAEAINISANYFSAIFSQEMNMTFVEYLTAKRMDKAKKLLRQTNQRSGKIALSVGYRDPRYFSFVFKKTQGCTPSAYRTQEEHHP